MDAARVLGLELNPKARGGGGGGVGTGVVKIWGFPLFRKLWHF